MIDEFMKPRWEWRCFSSHYDTLAEYFNRRDPRSISTSTEVYFLVQNPELNIKLRYGVLDVKQRLECEDSGIELWIPAFKGKLPLSTSEWSEFSRISGLTLSDTLIDSDEENFIEHLLCKNTMDHIHLTKIRQKYEIEGIAAELTTLELADFKVYTLALEHTDLSRIKEHIKEAGIQGEHIESYPAALKRLLKTSNGAS